MNQTLTRFPGELYNLKTNLSNSFFTRFCKDPKAMYDLGEVHAEFNARFFHGDLEILEPVLKVDANGETRKSYTQVKWDGRLGRRTLGVYRTAVKKNKQWSTRGPGLGVIAIAESLAPDIDRCKSVILHEMLHKWLHLKGLDDGVMGHGENFILHAKRINEMCEKMGVEYRVHFYDEVVTKEEPVAYAELLGCEVFLGKDLDVARKLKAVVRAAFDQKHEYRQ